jgi:hypothetical protein
MVKSYTLLAVFFVPGFMYIIPPATEALAEVARLTLTLTLTPVSASASMRRPFTLQQLNK